MSITALTLENYKPFGEKQRIEIKPLTILIGKNSSGKSALARLLLLLGRALSEKAESPVELNFDEVDFGDTFIDLIHNRIPHGAIGIGLTINTDEGFEEEFFVKLQHFDEYKLFIVSSFTYKNVEQVIELEWVGKDPMTDLKSYKICGTDSICDVEFTGIWISSIKYVGDSSVNSNSNELVRNIEEQLVLAKERFKIASKDITYLGPFREAPERTYRFPGTGAKNVGFRGKKAPELLGDDFLRRKGHLVSSVSTWFKENLGGWQLGVTKQGERFGLVMKSPKEPSLEVNVVDVGTGIAQVLPIVVQRYMDLASEGYRRIEIVEQPELHLHPSAHGSVADLYVASLSNNHNYNFIVETHSENFLLRIRRRIAEGSLDNDKVVVYWIDEEDGAKCIVKIKIDKNGDVNEWPTKVFSEDLDEVMAIRKAQRGK